MMLALALALTATAGGPVLTLAEAEQRARTLAPQARQASASTEVSRARAEEAAAPLYPQVVASAAYQRATSNFAPRPGSVPSGTSAASRTSFDTFNYWNFGVTASQLLYDFGQTTDRWRSAKASARSQEESERATRLSVLYGARIAFLGARAQKELVKVASETIANQERHLAQVQAFVEVKTRPEIDLAQARLDMANAQLSQITAENGYETAKATLNQAMGVESGTEYEVADETVPPVAGEEQGTDALLAEAMAARPELASLRRAVEAQELSVSAVKGGYGPSVSVSTGVTEAGAALGSMAPNWNAQIQLSWPLFTGMATPSQVREGQANLASMTAQMQVLRQQIRLDLEKARIGLRAAKAAVVVAEEALRNANERLTLAEGRYQAGVGNGIELGDAQLARTSAAAQRVQAEYALATARVQLLSALGRP